MEFFLKGIAAGFVIAAPFGPVAVLCFRRVLTERRMIGIFSVLGTAIADMVYGFIAALGLTALTNLLTVHQKGMHLFGGIFLLVLGGLMMRSKADAKKSGAIAPKSPWGAFISTLLLMLASPYVIFSFLAVFAVLDLGSGEIGLPDAALVGAGVFLGSAAWWVVFKLVSVWLAPKLRDGSLRIINLATGAFVCAVGVWQLAALAF